MNKGISFLHLTRPCSCKCALYHEDVVCREGYFHMNMDFKVFNSAASIFQENRGITKHVQSNTIEYL